MADFLGGDRAKPGAFVGEAGPRGGFGRRTPPTVAPTTMPTPAPAPAPVVKTSSDGFTLSAAAQRFVEEYRSQKTVANDIDFKIGGHDIQHVEIEFDPGEAVVAENGSMIRKDDDIDFSLVLGDGKDDKASLTSKLKSAGSNMLSGESFYLSQFKHVGSRTKAKAAFGGKMPGHIIPVRLETMGGTLICRRESFLVAAKGVAISAKLQRNLTAGLFGGEGLIMQTLTGTGWAFLHIGGSLIERELGPGEMIQVDSGCVAAHEPSVDMHVRFVGGVRTAIAGGEGILLSGLRGPGKVWIQSMPFKRIAEATVKAGDRDTAPSALSHAAAEFTINEGVDVLKRLFK